MHVYPRKDMSVDARSDGIAGGFAPVHKLCRAPCEGGALPELERAVALHLRLELIGLVAPRALSRKVHEAQQLFQCEAAIMIAAQAHSRLVGT